MDFEHAALNGFVLAPGGLKIEQMDKYPLPPESGTPVPEWHLSAETENKRADARVVAVLGISRSGSRIPLRDVEEQVSGSQVTVSFRRGNQPITVTFDTAQPSASVK